MEFNLLEILKYIVFGASFLVGGFLYTFEDDLFNPKIYSKAFIASVICFLMGAILELFNIFDLDKGMTFVIMSFSLIYCIFFQIFVSLFVKWKGEKPLFTSASSSIGGKSSGSIWTKSNAKRKFIRADFIFSLVQGLVPIFTFMALIFLIIELNR